SMGVPTIVCDCPVCHSPDPHDRRTRPSVLVEYNSRAVLIDTTPDFREQAIRENIRGLDAVLYTHATPIICWASMTCGRSAFFTNRIGYHCMHNLMRLILSAKCSATSSTQNTSSEGFRNWSYGQSMAHSTCSARDLSRSSSFTEMRKFSAFVLALPRTSRTIARFQRPRWLS